MLFRSALVLLLKFPTIPATAATTSALTADNYDIKPRDRFEKRKSKKSKTTDHHRLRLFKQSRSCLPVPSSPLARAPPFFKLIAAQVSPSPSSRAYAPSSSLLLPSPVFHSLPHRSPHSLVQASRHLAFPNLLHLLKHVFCILDNYNTIRS